MFVNTDYYGGDLETGSVRRNDSNNMRVMTMKWRRAMIEMSCGSRFGRKNI
jgi:hypothetical protein